MFDLKQVFIVRFLETHPKCAGAVHFSSERISPKRTCGALSKSAHLRTARAVPKMRTTHPGYSLMKSSIVRTHRRLYQNRVALVALDEVPSTVRMATMESQLVPGIKSCITQATPNLFFLANLQMLFLDV